MEALGQKVNIKPPFPRGQFGLIYADPPWHYEMYSDKGYEKSPDAHYSCMTFDALAAMRDDVTFATAPDAVLFMWCVWPKIHEALELMRIWGYQYKTGGAWHKMSKSYQEGQANAKSAFGTGYILRSACEPFIIGTHGNPNIKNRSTRNIIQAAVREHSQKPQCTYDILENLFDGAYLELFARNSRPNWISWGNEVNKYDEALGVAV